MQERLRDLPDEGPAKVEPLLAAVPERAEEFDAGQLERPGRAGHKPRGKTQKDWSVTRFCAKPADLESHLKIF